MSSDRLSLRSVLESPETPQFGTMLASFGKDASRHEAEALVTGPPEAPKKTRRLSKDKLYELLETLSDRDIAFLESLNSCRYLLTGQLQRLHIPVTTTQHSATRRTNLVLNRLKDQGLVRTFSRRIGGSRRGSSSYVWHLTEAGVRLLNLRHGLENSKRYRYLEPSFSNLRHTIAVAECYVQLVELTREYPLLKITEVQWEPECWRPYEFRGEKGILKPDLFVVTEDIGYENRWFIELDLNTEGLPSIVEKCRRYQLLYQTGSEQKAYGVFPYTLWITTDEGRRDRMQEAINEAFGKSARMFRVITADEFRNVMKD